MPQGSFQVTVRAADAAFPVPFATVRVSDENGVLLYEERVSAANGGLSSEFFIDAPSRERTLQPGDPRPYGLCNVSVEAEGFYSVTVRKVQIIDGERSILPVDMIPRGQSADERIEYEITPHGLTESIEKETQGPSEDERVLTSVFIPERITVHLGSPNSSAANVSVPFPDYIKNVASSEIYPTWPRESLRANILCQISFALNRIFTEWYPSREYSFNITNSTAYDQYYVYGRNIFDNISQIVDEIFNEYIRRPGRIDPYFAEYCNGSTVTCAGLSQWGTVSLANDGLRAIEILQFYYGNVEITETNDIRAIESSYPGTPLRRGSSGNAVRTIQQQLNRIRVNYPSIPAINRVDGIFGAETEAAVRRFQEIFDLTRDGIVGKSTWYRISYIYVAVKKLAELNSEGERPQYDDDAFPGILSFGDTGTAVQTLQFYLATIAAFNPFLVPLRIDGRFERQTENAVRAFQEYYGLDVDGVVGERTWSRIVSVYRDVTANGRITLRQYPGRVQRQGSSGDDVLYLQILLNLIRPVFVTIPLLEEDGIFGPRMRRAVTTFQNLFGLAEDGIVGERTWNAMNRVYGAIASGCLKDGTLRTGRILQFGSSGADVRVLQEELNTARRALAVIPALTVDGNFGRNTDRAVRSFQSVVGLSVDGIVGNTTRTRLYTFANAVRTGCLSPVTLREERQPATRIDSPGPVTRRNERAVSVDSPWPVGCPWRDQEEWDRR